ncbi:Gfo/Idh/MocA family protein [Propionibacteriaceae bacterium Y1685]|uniref:Gfo/Idh/MocA family protein n=1 Tax=Microlunatus sp. Y1700 TaxID=3418487 RepID=UPI003B7F818D
MMDRLGVGLVGAGSIAESHAEALNAVPGLQLVAVHDRDPAALLAHPAVDVVVLGTPNDTYAELAPRIAAAGKHLLLGEPLAFPVADAQRIVDAFAERGLTLLPGHTYRHRDDVRAVSQALADGVVGTPRSMRIAITGGPGVGVHLYDLAHWWMGGPAVRVFAIAQQLTSAVLPIDDALVATLEFTNGATAICEISRGEGSKTSGLFEIVVHGTTGTLVRRWTSEGAMMITDDHAGPLAAAVGSPLVRQLTVLTDAIRSGTPVCPSPADAVHAIAIAEAVEASARTGDVIAVDSEGRTA